MKAGLWVTFVALLFSAGGLSQGCCSGGSGNPIAGGTSLGVLEEKQAELAFSHQYSGSRLFRAGSQDTAAMLDLFYSNYLYGKFAYGVTDKFTVSLESGYFLNKTQYGLGRKDTVRSSGIGDLIVFPRYTVYSRNSESTRTELTLGMGYKIPLGSYSDSTVVYRHPVSGARFYTTSPPTVQPTTGSQDLILYAFAYHGLVEQKLRFFCNAIYIHRGWNGLGQKFGDYTSIGLFAGKNITKRLSLTVQLRGEYVNLMKYDRNLDMLALYNIDVNSTGSRKLFISPQINYTYKKLVLFALYEAPLYQYVNGVQIASQHQLTTGLSFRFRL